MSTHICMEIIDIWLDMAKSTDNSGDGIALALRPNTLPQLRPKTAQGLISRSTAVQATQVASEDKDLVVAQRMDDRRRDAMVATDLWCLLHKRGFLTFVFTREPFAEFPP